MDEDQNQQVIDEQELSDQTDLEAQIAALKEESQKNLNGWMRSQADFQNYQKREEQKRAELVDFAREVAVVKLLPTLDVLRQGMLHRPVEENPEARAKNPEFFEKYEQWQNGMTGTLRQLEKALEELGIKPIEALGKKFDPHLHEAVREVPGEEDGVIVEEYQTGYQINGKVIRPSQVVISKKS